MTMNRLFIGLLAIAAGSVSLAQAAPKAVPQTLSADDAIARITEVRTLARTAALCRWSDADEARTLANHSAPILIGLATRSFQACLRFTKANGKLAGDELMGEAPAINRSVCGNAGRKEKWVAVLAQYDIDRAREVFDGSTYSESICAFQPLETTGKTDASMLQGLLLKASSLCNAQAVEKAIELGADVNQPGNKLPEEYSFFEGGYALRAVLETMGSGNENSCSSTIRALLKKGADPKLRFGDKTALHLALDASASSIEELIAAGADPNATITGELPASVPSDDYGPYGRIDIGQTPLMNFVKIRGSMMEGPAGNNASGQEVKRILDIYLKKSNLNARDWLGRTALMLAIDEKANKAARLLLAAGADKKIKDNYGHDALYYARASKNAEMQKILAQAK